MKNDRDDRSRVPVEQLTAYERWELPLLDQQGNEVPKEEIIDIQPLTASDLQDIRKAAVDDGHAEGHQAGYDAGFVEGRKAGPLEETAEAVRAKGVECRVVSVDLTEEGSTEKIASTCEGLDIGLVSGAD